MLPLCSQKPRFPLVPGAHWSVLCPCSFALPDCYIKGMVQCVDFGYGLVHLEKCF